MKRFLKTWWKEFVSVLKGWIPTKIKMNDDARAFVFIASVLIYFVGFLCAPIGFSIYFIVENFEWHYLFLLVPLFFYTAIMWALMIILGDGLVEWAEYGKANWSHLLDDE